MTNVEFVSKVRNIASDLFRKDITKEDALTYILTYLLNVNEQRTKKGKLNDNIKPSSD